MPKHEHALYNTNISLHRNGNGRILPIDIVWYIFCTVYLSGFVCVWTLCIYAFLGCFVANGFWCEGKKHYCTFKRLAKTIGILPFWYGDVIPTHTHKTHISNCFSHTHTHIHCHDFTYLTHVICVETHNIRESIANPLTFCFFCAFYPHTTNYQHFASYYIHVRVWICVTYTCLLFVPSNNIAVMTWTHYNTNKHACWYVCRRSFERHS